LSTPTATRLNSTVLSAQLTAQVFAAACICESPERVDGDLDAVADRLDEGIGSTLQRAGSPNRAMSLRLERLEVVMV
jgi:hypothetical protein